MYLKSLFIYLFIYFLSPQANEREKERTKEAGGKGALAKMNIILF